MEASVNRSKTKYLCIGDDRDDLHSQEIETISCCTEYTYLGSKIDNEGRTEKEIEDRIIKGKKVIGCLNSCGPNVSLEKRSTYCTTQQI